MKITQPVMSFCINYSKILTDLKSRQNITHKYLGLVFIAKTHASVVLVT